MQPLKAEAFGAFAPKSLKMRVIADLLDKVDAANVGIAELLGPVARHADTGELLIPFSVSAAGPGIQGWLREWADQLDQGVPLYNTPQDNPPT